MGLSLNMILKRIRTVTEAHKQIRRFQISGSVTDFFADKISKYPACCLQYNAGSIGGGEKIINFRMWLLDLVHVSEETKLNEDDVLSDTYEIISDLVAELAQPAFNDWAFSLTNNLQSVFEGDNDLNAGWYIDFSIRVPFAQNICAVPSDLFVIPGSGTDAPGIGTDMKVYDKEYFTTGAEGTTLTISDIAGKKILFITREGYTIYKVSNAPDTEEYIWDDTNIILGRTVNADERFLILYRNY